MENEIRLWCRLDGGSFIEQCLQSLFLCLNDGRTHTHIRTHTPALLNPNLAFAQGCFSLSPCHTYMCPNLFLVFILQISLCTFSASLFTWMMDRHRHMSSHSACIHSTECIGSNGHQMFLEFSNLGLYLPHLQSKIILTNTSKSGICWILIVSFDYVWNINYLPDLVLGFRNKKHNNIQLML